MNNTDLYKENSARIQAINEHSRDVRSFSSSGKKVTSSRKKYKLNDEKFIKFIIKVGLVLGAGALLMAGIKKDNESSKNIDPKTGFELYDNSYETHKPGF